MIQQFWTLDVSCCSWFPSGLLTTHLQWTYWRLYASFLCDSNVSVGTYRMTQCSYIVPPKRYQTQRVCDYSMCSRCLVGSSLGSWDRSSATSSTDTVFLADTIRHIHDVYYDTCIHTMHDQHDLRALSQWHSYPRHPGWLRSSKTDDAHIAFNWVLGIPYRCAHISTIYIYIYIYIRVRG